MGSKPQRSPEVIAEIARRYAADECVADLASEYGCARSTVVAYARRCGYEIRSEGSTARAEWRADWWWEFAKEQWPEDARIMDTVACREIYGSRAVTAAANMRARYEGALAVLRLDARALAAARKAAAE